MAEKLVRFAGRAPGRIFEAGGKRQLDPKLRSYNRSAHHAPWLVLRDLDHDDASGCIGDLVRGLMGGNPAPNMAFRLPVRCVEAWLLADRDGFADFFHVSPDLVAPDPEVLEHPKAELVSICRHSRARWIREAMVPREGSGRAVGKEYTSLVSEYAADVWDPEKARTRSPSLDRSLMRVSELAARGSW